MKIKINKKNILTLSGSLLGILVIAILTLSTGGSNRPKNLEITPGGEIIINKSDITNTASFYPYESNGTYMEIIAVRASDDTIRTALNTCTVCYSSGKGYYEQLGDVLICNNCGNQFTIDQIGLMKGGCNPVPILEDMKDEDAEQIKIYDESLVAFEPLFKKWKK